MRIALTVLGKRAGTACPDVGQRPVHRRRGTVAGSGARSRRPGRVGRKGTCPHPKSWTSPRIKSTEGRRPSFRKNTSSIRKTKGVVPSSSGGRNPAEEGATLGQDSDPPIAGKVQGKDGDYRPTMLLLYCHHPLVMRLTIRLWRSRIASVGHQRAHPVRANDYAFNKILTPGSSLTKSPRKRWQGQRPVRHPPVDEGLPLDVRPSVTSS